MNSIDDSFEMQQDSRRRQVFIRGIEFFAWQFHSSAIPTRRPHPICGRHLCGSSSVPLCQKHSDGLACANQRNFDRAQNPCFMRMLARYLDNCASIIQNCWPYHVSWLTSLGFVNAWTHAYGTLSDPVHIGSVKLSRQCRFDGARRLFPPVSRMPGASNWKDRHQERAGSSHAGRDRMPDK